MRPDIHPGDLIRNNLIRRTGRVLQVYPVSWRDWGALVERGSEREYWPLLVCEKVEAAPDNVVAFQRRDRALPALRPEHPVGGGSAA